jgi:hypothetical protein
MTPIEKIREKERRWLGKHGLLERPWFILASAPDPTIPAGITDSAALICINNAVATAARVGLRPADLTFRAGHKEWQSAAGCTLPLVLWLSDDFFRFYRRTLFSRAKVKEFRMMRLDARQQVTTHMLESDLADVGRKHKPSTGIFAVLYALFTGVPQIVLGGVSVDKDGYSYGSLPGIQVHRDEDLFAMQLIAERYPAVTTSEREVSEKTGLLLFG